ncbi:MAG: type I glyceraldehyde-3-phosphate dehydrogenase, partial [Bacteroidales bacterium]
VNHHTYNNESIVSNASCTTNCLAPIAKILNDKYGIKEGLMTTIHPVTGSQNVVDGTSSRDFRSGRSGLANIIPYQTGAAKSIGKVIPELSGKLTGICFRIPTLDVSAIDLSVELNTPATYDDICRTIKDASQNSMQNIIAYVDDELVSSDFLSEKTPSLFDARAGLGVSDTYFKIIAWYDNETGYSSQLLNLIRYISEYGE